MKRVQDPDAGYTGYLRFKKLFLLGMVLLTLFVAVVVIDFLSGYLRRKLS